MAGTKPSSLARTREQLRHHYEVEVRLAAQLRAAPREQRFHMLTGLYEELFREVPHHPRLVTKPYGKIIVASLPPMKRTRDLAEVEEFLRR